MLRNIAVQVSRLGAANRVTRSLRSRTVMASSGKSEGEESGGGAGPAPETGERFTFFFGAASPFSQWHSAVFSVDGVEYNCAEQYMMHQKAGQSLNPSP